MDDWRTLLYPLGFLSALAFGGRFIIQWLQSEKAGESSTPRSFWHLSLIGNLLLMLHSFIQIQYHICLIQACHAVISWRNLNLFQITPLSFRAIIYLLIGAIVLVTFAFAMQDFLLLHEGNWFRTPVTPWSSTSSALSLFWHLLGSLGYLLFSSRFWIQWWSAEKAHVSQFPLAFWWLSLAGAIFSMIYFLRMKDSVNLLGPLLGIIPYIRNLMLIYKTKTAVSQL